MKQDRGSTGDDSVVQYDSGADGSFARRTVPLAKVPHRIPRLKSAALSRILPLQGSGWSTSISVLGVAPPVDRALREVWMNSVTVRFFETMGIPLLLGRTIEERDLAGASRVAVINETLARTYFPHESPMGKHFRDEVQEYEIVGVVRDSKYNQIRSAVVPSILRATSKAPRPSGPSPSNSKVLKLRPLSPVRFVAPLPRSIPTFPCSVLPPEKRLWIG